MKKSIILIALFLLVPVLLLGQENPNFQQNYFLTKVDLDSANAKSVKLYFPRNPTTIASVTASRLSITNDRGAFWVPGFYRVWVRGDTTSTGDTIGDTDSLNVTFYELNYDGTRADQESTLVVTNLNWDVDTWHGPFDLIIFGPSFGMDAVIQKTCTGSADTCEVAILIIY